VKNLAGFVVRVERAQLNKEVRATPYAVQVDEGNIFVLRKEWTGDFVLEHEKFPAGRVKDQVDSASGAFNKLVQHIHLRGTW
jgi:predicted phage terminase large subunit-like protein